MRLLILLLMLINISTISAQQDPVFSHVFLDKVSINPAFAGSEGDICIGIINRQQWVGFEGAPKTTTLNANMPINLLGINSGVGLSITDDRLGFESNFRASLQYAYYKTLGKGLLSLGLQAGLYNIAFEGNWVTPGTSADTDPSIPTEKDNSMVFDMAMGALYKLDNLYIGLSASHLTQTKFKFTNINASYLKRHYYLITGYNLQLMGGNLDLKPNLLLKTDAASSQITINLTALYNKKIWGGVSYRTTNSIDVLAGIELINGIRIGYAYGLNFSKLISTNSGSHEVMLSYCFDVGFNKTPQKYRSVRFL